MVTTKLAAEMGKDFEFQTVVSVVSVYDQETLSVIVLHVFGSLCPKVFSPWQLVVDRSVLLVLERTRMEEINTVPLEKLFLLSSFFFSFLCSVLRQTFSDYTLFFYDCHFPFVYLPFQLLFSPLFIQINSLVKATLILLSYFLSCKRLWLSDRRTVW